MKNRITIMMLMIVCCMLSMGTRVMASSSTPVSSGKAVTIVSEQGNVQTAFAQTTVDNKVVAGKIDEPGGFLADNWGRLVIGLLGFFDLVARLTPTTRDNSIVNFLTAVINAIIPNFKKGDGTFNLESQYINL